ncbi:MAG: hypothetical protein ACOYXM_01665 [Actinomycetota bacterium]
MNTTISQAWLDELVPEERRHEGDMLIRDVKELQESIEGVLGRFVRIYEAHEATYEAAMELVTRTCGDRGANGRWHDPDRA